MIDPDTGILLHNNDGLIYTIDACPYYPGTCEDIIKWKPPHMNSIDFSFVKLGKFHDDEIWGLYVKSKPEFRFDIHVFNKKDEKQIKMHEEVQKAESKMINPRTGLI